MWCVASARPEKNCCWTPRAQLAAVSGESDRFSAEFSGAEPLRRGKFYPLKKKIAKMGRICRNVAHLRWNYDLTKRKSSRN
jgi:hypothetical protein